MLTKISSFTFAEYEGRRDVDDADYSYLPIQAATGDSWDWVLKYETRDCDWNRDKSWKGAPMILAAVIKRNMTDEKMTVIDVIKRKQREWMVVKERFIIPSFIVAYLIPISELVENFYRHLSHSMYDPIGLSK